jgi:DMSO/TMAO reductase YedYZ heme-binding membrane subunit
MRTKTLLPVTNFSLIVLILGFNYFNNLNGAAITSLIGTLFLLLTLLPNNLIRINRFSGNQRLRNLAQYRKEFGISAGIWFVIHSILSVQKYFAPNIALIIQLTSREIISGFISLVVFVLLLITSNKWSQTILKENWKKLHSLVWLVLPLIMVHSALAPLYYEQKLLLPPLIIYGGLIGFAVVEYFLLNSQNQKNYGQHMILVAIGTALAAIVTLLTTAASAKI